MKVEREILLNLSIEYRPRALRRETRIDPEEPAGYDIIKVEHNGVELDLTQDEEQQIEQELIDDQPDLDDEVDQDDCSDDKDED